MGRISLLKGSYQARSVIADNQACLNLYPEMNPGDQDKPLTCYLTPGLTKLVATPMVGEVRAQYRASNGEFFRIIGQHVYFVDSSWTHYDLGSVASSTGIVNINDNTLALVLVDGSATGYAIDLASHAFGQITSPYFFGSTGIGMCDTYLIFNNPGTNGWYVSYSNVSYDMLTGIYGGILSGSILNPGASYTDGTYLAVALTGGSGSGAQATIVVSAGVVTTVTVTAPGVDYQVNDILSATFGGGTGFGYTVLTCSGIAFDPLAYATKSGTGDIIQTLAVVRNEVWLLGQITTEVWYDAGNPDFPFARLPGVFIEKGCAAVYSPAKHNEMLFWVAQDRDGSYEIVVGQNYQVVKVSTNAIDNALTGYPTVEDAIGYCYQQEGHPYYVVAFPSADVTWVYDIGQQLWHQRASVDDNGVLHRHRGQCGVFVYQTNTVGDYANGDLYKFDLNNYTDNGTEIVRIRRFQHITNELKRTSHKSFIADIEAGTNTGALTGGDEPPQVFLSWSDNRGKTYGTPVAQSLGEAGQLQTILKWSRLGISRDRVYQLQWSFPLETALQGAFLEVSSAET